MAESQRTTFEEASCCPKCGQPGEDVATQPTKKPGVVVHVIFCRQELCPWYNTNWLVQVNADGTVPAPYSQIGPKSYPKLSPESETRVTEAIKRQLEGETSAEGLEVINPYG